MDLDLTAESLSDFVGNLFSLHGVVHWHSKTFYAPVSSGVLR